MNKERQELTDLLLEGGCLFCHPSSKDSNRSKYERVLELLLFNLHEKGSQKNGRLELLSYQATIAMKPQWAKLYPAIATSC